MNRYTKTELFKHEPEARMFYVFDLNATEIQQLLLGNIKIIQFAVKILLLTLD